MCLNPLRYSPMNSQVEGAQKMNAMMDAINLYNLGGKTIIFVNTKSMCDQVCGYRCGGPEARVLSEISLCSASIQVVV